MSTPGMRALNLLGHTYLTLRCKKSEEGASSPTSPRKKRAQPPFKCEDHPDIDFAHLSSLERHRQGKHKDRLPCSQPDCPHTWQASRRSEFKEHLRKKHKRKDKKIDDEVERILELSRPTVIESDLTPPPAIDANHTSLPVIPSASVAYNSELRQAEPDVTSTEPEEPSGLEHLAATHVPSAFLSEEEFAVLVRYLEIHGRIRFVHAMLFICDIYDRLCSRIPTVFPGETTIDDIAGIP
jgi:hypothetical protein